MAECEEDTLSERDLFAPSAILLEQKWLPHVLDSTEAGVSSSGMLAVNDAKRIGKQDDHATVPIQKVNPVPPASLRWINVKIIMELQAELPFCTPSFPSSTP